MPADRSSEAEALAALRAGNEAALDAVMSRWQRPLFAFAWRYLRNRADAEDAVIETFVRLHERRGRLRADTNLPAWLFTTLANLCHNQHRWRRRHPGTNGGASAASFENQAAAENIPGDSSGASSALENNEAAAAVRAAIDRLPHDQRAVLLLHHYEQLGYREIGAIVGCAERGVETRLYRARQKLREELAPFLREVAAR